MKRPWPTPPLPEAAPAKLIIRVLLDEGVPVSVARVFEGCGHVAIRHADVLAPGSGDLLVARAAQVNDATLIAIDKDMKRITGRYGEADPKFQLLNVIKIGCSEPLAAARIEQAMELIELEWRFRCQQRGRRLYIEIGPHWIRTHR